MPTLTLDTLRRLGACSGQTDLFQKHFGNTVEVTPELCESVAGIFDWNWAARYLLQDQARAEYYRVRGQAQAEYNRVRAQACAEYDRVTAQARAEYDLVTAQAYAKYFRVTDQAWAEYNRVTASTFGMLYTGAQS